MSRLTCFPEKTPALRSTEASKGEATTTPCTSSGVGVNLSMVRPGFGADQPDFTGSSPCFAHVPSTRDLGQATSPETTTHGRGNSFHTAVSWCRSPPDCRCHQATSAAINRSTLPGHICSTASSIPRSYISENQPSRNLFQAPAV